MFTAMPKASFYAIIAVVRLVVKSFDYVLRLVDVIRDLVDDGCLNDSLTKEYHERFDAIKNSVEALSLSLSDLKVSDDE